MIGIVGAALGGAAVGLEREHSRAAGREERFAGIRTFTLLGGLAGIAGRLWTGGFPLASAVLLAGGATLAVAGYVATSRRQLSATTEAAALVVLAAGFLAGTGQLALASGIIAVTVLILVEKSRLHALAARIDDAELRAGIRFAVMAVVILPLLPEGPYGPWGGVRPRQLWVLVLLFAGLSFAGYVARRAIGPERGCLLTGLLGGLVSSTGVTLLFARASDRRPALARPLAYGVAAACTVMFVRMLLATAVLHWPLALALAPYLVAPLAVGAVLTLAGALAEPEAGAGIETPSNPLEFRTALQMTALFQVVLFAMFVVEGFYGALGVLLSAAAVGLTDVDALTISMARSAAGGLALDVCARALAIGALANTVLKLGVVAGLGGGQFRRVAAARLIALALALALGLAVAAMA